MSRIIVRSKRARRDLAEIAVGFDLASDTLSERFLASVDEELRQLSRMPGPGAKVEFRAANVVGLRCTSVPNFPNYLIFYRYDDDKVEVIRVLHGARDIETLLGDFDE